MNKKNLMVLFFFVGFILTSFVLLRNYFSNPFVLDDFEVIVNNESIRSLSSIDLYLSDYFNRSIFYSTLAVNYFLGKLDPFGYRVVNFILHLSNAFLVFFFSFTLLKFCKFKYYFYGSMIASLVFYLHPIQITTINHITTRSVLLCTFFYLLALLCFFHAFFVKTKFFKIVLFLMTVLFFVLALGSKSIAISFPSVAFLLYFIFIRKDEKFKIPLFLSFVFCCSFFCGAFYVLLKSNQVLQIFYVSMFDNLITQLTVWVKYFYLFFYPIMLVPEYDIAFKKWFDLDVLMSAFMVFSSVFFAIKYFRKYPFFSFSLVLFYLLVFPSSGLIPRMNTMLLYRLYLPMVSFSFFSGGVFSTIYGAFINIVLKRIFIFATVSIFVLLTIVSHNQNVLFSSNTKLWQRMVKIFPNNYISNYNYGTFLLKDNELEKAIDYLQIAINEKSDFAKAYFHLGLAKHKMGNVKEALFFYNKALKLSPESYEYYVNLGNAFYQLNQFNDAQRCYKIYLIKGKKEAPVYNNLFYSLVALDARDEALDAINSALVLAPKNKLYLDNKKRLMSNLSSTF